MARNEIYWVYVITPALWQGLFFGTACIEINNQSSAIELNSNRI